MTDTVANRLAGHRVTVVSNEQPGRRMAGPAIRATNLARQLLVAGADVTLACPRLPDIDLELPVRVFDSPSAAKFRSMARSCDVVVTQPQRVDVASGLHRGTAAVVYDCYVPSFVEYPASLSVQGMSSRKRAKLIQRNQLEYATAVDCGDAFLVASQRQRDFLVGALGQAGRLQDIGTDHASEFPQVSVVPFGLPVGAPRISEASPLRGRLVPDDAVVALWTGGVWNWFDPLTVIRGVARARAHVEKLHLVFLASGHPSSAFQGQDAATSALASPEVAGLVDSGVVVFADDWVPYDDRGSFLADADMGVCAFYDSLETRMSFRTRFLDHLWAGLPTVTTSGGVLSELMCSHSAGVCLPAGDTDAWAAALIELSSDVALRRQMSGAARQLAERFTWPQVAAPLVRLVAEMHEGQRGPRRQPGPARLANYLAVAAENRWR